MKGHRFYMSKQTGVQIGVIKYFPDWPVFRRLASKTKIWMTYRTALPEADVRRGEGSSNERHKVVEDCSKKWPSEANRINRRIDRLFRSIPFYQENNVDMDQIREDMVFKFFAYGFLPNEYFAFRLDNKTPEQTREFISDRLRTKFRCQMNNILQAKIFNDKAETYELFKEQYHRDVVAVDTPRDYDKFLDFVKRHPEFVKKQVYLAQGHSVELVDINTISISERDYFNQLIQNGKHILEERIVQSYDLARFNESSVNTVRAITFNTKHGIKVPYCMIRTGRPGAFVDNSGGGGIQAEIDFESGIIVSDGFDELGGHYVAHPGSGVVFQEYWMPNWDQLKELVFTSATKVPGIKFIGWDLAHTKDGWVIVEGNESCYIIALQQIRDTGMRSIFEKLMDDMDLYA